jgi:hypothetical protein
MSGKALETAAQSSLSFRCWLRRRVCAAVGRRDCRVGYQRRGIEVVKSDGEGRTACHGARAEVVLRRRSVARRLWIVLVFGRARVRDLGTE